MKSSRNCSGHALALVLVAACGPEANGDDGLPADDMAWLIDSFAHGCEEPVTQCLVAHYYEFVFKADGTLQTYDVVCGVRESAQMDRQGRWRPTDEYGVAEILPRDGEDSFKATLESISRGLVRRTEDCDIVEVDFDADGTFGLPIYRGVFRYDIAACVSEADYLSGPPTCPDSLQ
ncbi:MAG: hypothetical protein IPK74_00055 [Deltaproteobacteria bacterium]|nr:hypothetical protein [Deltaproteobacteria bacterium]